MVVACLRVAQQRRIDDPAIIAHHAQGLDRARWERALAEHEEAPFQRRRATILGVEQPEQMA